MTDVRDGGESVSEAESVKPWTAAGLSRCHCGQVAPAEASVFPHPGCGEGTAERRARYFAEEEGREFRAWMESQGLNPDPEYVCGGQQLADAFAAGKQAGARLYELSETVDRSARGALFRDLPAGVAAEVLDSDPPAVYARWCRAGWPAMTDASITQLWRWRSAGEYEFWLGLDAEAGAGQ